MAEDGFARRVTLVGALADPVRRRLYRFVAEQPGAVSRDQAATGVAVPRHTAKFHLDKLVDEGLLVTEFRRLSGRTGPGAGRPAKLYSRARREISVSLPDRRYDLAGRVLADAVERALEGAPMAEALDAAAEAAATAVVGTYDETPPLREVLDRLGYEPRADGTLANCPYALLAGEHPDLVCSVNASFVGSLCRQVDPEGGSGVVRTAAEPPPHGCCVQVTAR